jgi:hypothetical protein
MEVGRMMAEPSNVKPCSLMSVYSCLFVKLLPKRVPEKGFPFSVKYIAVVNIGYPEASLAAQARSAPL